MNAVLAELGPVLPPRGAVYSQAAEVLRLARLAAELTAHGGEIDIPRALRQFERIRAVLGAAEPGDE